MSSLENKARKDKKLSEFIMMLFYVCVFLVLVNWAIQYTVFLSMELLFSLIYIESKREPEKMVSIWGFIMKSNLIYLDAYVPLALLALSVLTGGNIIGDLIGIAVGHVYFYLKDIAPLHFRRDYLMTPNFVKRYFDINTNPRFSQVNQSNGNTGNANQGNPGFRNAWGGNQNNNQGNNNRGGFQAFGGQGYTWG